jgi:hypothetical protein
MAEPVEIDSRRHSDAPASRRVTLSPAERAELVRLAEHWLSALEGAGPARVVLDLGPKGLTMRGGAGA